MPPPVGAFLHHLEHGRHNGAPTRNARLAAVHSFFRFGALWHPGHAASSAGCWRSPPNAATREVCCLTPGARRLVAAPDREPAGGRRDHALLLLAVQTGLRVSELTGLASQDIKLGARPHVRCRGKGRKDRATPLTAQTVKVLQDLARRTQPSPRRPAVPDKVQAAACPATPFNGSLPRNDVHGREQAARQSRRSTSPRTR